MYIVLYLFLIMTFFQFSGARKGRYSLQLRTQSILDAKLEQEKLSKQKQHQEEQQHQQHQQHHQQQHQQQHQQHNDNFHEQQGECHPEQSQNFHYEPQQNTYQPQQQPHEQEQLRPQYDSYQSALEYQDNAGYISENDCIAQMNPNDMYSTSPIDLSLPTVQYNTLSSPERLRTNWILSGSNQIPSGYRPSSSKYLFFDNIQC